MKMTSSLLALPPNMGKDKLSAVARKLSFSTATESFPK